MGCIIVTYRFRIAKIVLVWYLRWPPRWPSWKSSNLICYQGLPLKTKEHPSDWAKTWWEALGWHGDSELLKTFCYVLLRYPLWPHFAPGQLMPWPVNHGPSLNRMSVSNFPHFRHLHQNHIHDGRQGGHLESLQLLSAPEQQVRWSRNLMEGIRAAWRFRITKMVPFWYPWWPPWQPSWKSSNHICYWTVSLIELKHNGRHWGVMEIQNC